MLKKVVIGLLSGFVVMTLVVVFGWFLLNWSVDKPVLLFTTQDFTIEEGDSLNYIGKRLEDLGVIDSFEVFSIMGQLLGVATSLQRGDYQITPGISVREVLVMFTQGQVRYYDVTLVEGLRFVDIIQQLNSHPKLTEPLSEQDLQSLFTQLGINGSPEGLFYPDTYFFESGEQVRSVLVRAHKRLNQVLEEEWRNKSRKLPYETPYEALVLASIIEKETGATFERPDISGVFVRRLQLNMRLQSDPTVIYGMGDMYQGGLNRKNLREKTSYNTYVINGLPPSPIALVGREAINAALHPSEGKTLYFVAKGDGTHYFSESLAEHNKAVRKYQVKGRRVDYRSSVVN
ncbi:MAG: endolytic transglycosylase MltG [Candidatus Endonucleobacter sp. (ex Gigantidas childressi)]|nr:endolytic transglycosylase MltG [Candidatus Endonucleobacter sp. (ex Gigantidas childressi)]